MKNSPISQRKKRKLRESQGVTQPDLRAQEPSVLLITSQRGLCLSGELHLSVKLDYS